MYVVCTYLRSAGLTRHDPGYIRLSREGRYLAGQKVVSVCWSMSEADRGKTTEAWPTKVTMPMSDDAGAAEAHVTSAWMTRGKSDPVGLLFWEEAYSLEYASTYALIGDLSTSI